uniref:Leucine rich immune protein (Coil-less) n=1 Tax=Anopheles epiroticus TaxID=199890 RepID=A0A182PKB5_9DIPT
MSPSVVHLMHTEVEDVQFDENTSLQDFRADYTSLEVVSPTVSKLQSLDVLWITHSQLRNFSFDVLENSPVSLLYLVGNKIESITISPGLVCCRNLEEIFLSDNHLKLLDFGTIALMSKLKAMFVEQNRLTDGVLNIPGMDQNQMLITAKGDTFCSWRRYYIEQDLNQEVQTPNCTDYFATLLAVHLSRNRFEHINFSIFSLMNSLNSLDLSKNQLVDMIATEDQVPVRLSELFGSNNNISELYLSPLLSMKAIYLLDNNLKTLNMSNLPRDLDYLNLINNPLNCNELPHMNKSTIIPLLGPYTEC